MDTATDQAVTRWSAIFPAGEVARVFALFHDARAWFAGDDDRHLLTADEARAVAEQVCAVVARSGGPLLMSAMLTLIMLRIQRDHAATETTA